MVFTDFIKLNFPIILINLGILFFVLISKNKNNRKTLIALISIIVSSILIVFQFYNHYFNTLDFVIDGRYAISFFVYLLLPISFYLVFVMSIDNKKLIIYSIFPLIYNFLIYFISLFNHSIYSYTSNNIEIRNFFGYTSYIVSMVYFISYVLYKIINFKKYSMSEIYFFAFSFVIMIISLIFENILKLYTISMSAIYFSILNMYIFEYINNVSKQSMESEKMIQEQRTSLTISQIQPHFLYNTLGTISYICKKDPKLASKALDDFSDYLRANLNSIRQKSNVPFLLELNHVKTYLNLEQLRFEEKLKVIYDIQYSDFLIPSLSIQPIVENAVKHGICEKMSGGTIYVRTVLYEDSIKIIIEDDGVGFDENAFKNDGRSHVGIENVKSRLETMCNGRLDIRSKIGRGTTATITLPRR